jgi:alkanesulfonate monooxygenase SsuD/methylene tetrahydromethanopterin reductase-like flavin-dependent oxidoreductase (luciferase family)
MLMAHKVQFGLFQPQVGLSFPLIKERALAAEEHGFHSIWFPDHMWVKGMTQMDYLESWTLMTATAAVTSRLRIGSLVLCNSFRTPAFLAKMAATLDNISNGRLELGLGAGWMEDEYKGYGYAFPSGGARANQLKEGVEIIKKMFTEEKPSYAGKHFTIDGAYNNPKPVQKPHPPITIGAAAERKMLKLVAQHADRWNCPAAVAHRVEQKWGVIVEHCKALGRNPEEIGISEQVVCVLGKDKADFEKKWPLAKQTLGRLADLDRTALRGDPAGVIDGVREKNRKGVSLFCMVLSDIAQDDFLNTLKLFAQEIMPAFR